MSVYHEAAAILAPPEQESGSLKSRVFAANNLKSTPQQLFALVSEAVKWNAVLNEVVEHSQLLQKERKVRSRDSRYHPTMLTDTEAL